MIILGLTGPIGHGKSTLAKALTELDPTAERLESSMIVAEVVNALHASTKTIPPRDNTDAVNEWLTPLPAILLQTVKVKTTFDNIRINPADVTQHPLEYEKLFLHIDNLEHNPDLLNHEINRDNKEQYRPILQWIGGYLVKHVDPKIWYNEIVRRAYAAADRGCQLCLVGGLRFPSDADVIHQAGGVIVKVFRPGHLEFDLLDPTERERESIKVDSMVVSDSGIEEIRQCAKLFLEDLKNNRLQSSYIASHIASKSQ